MAVSELKLFARQTLNETLGAVEQVTISS